MSIFRRKKDIAQTKQIPVEDAQPAMPNEEPPRIADRVRDPIFHQQKTATVESLVSFAQGGELPKWPLEVFLEISNICDLQCAMCPTFSALNPNRFKILKNNDRGLLSFEQTSAPMESVLEHALIVHAFGYGEPTIHPQFKEFITYLSKFEVMVDFFTHGMHLTQEMCEFLVQQNVVRITISFSGATEEEYENVYLGGDFQRVLTGIKTLAETKKKYNSHYPSIDVNSLGFNHQIEKLPEFVKLMGEHGANAIHLKPLQTYDTIRELHTHSSIMRPEIEGKILAEAKRVAGQYDLILASEPYEQTAQVHNSKADSPQQARHKGSEQLSETSYEISELKFVSKSLEKKEEIRAFAREQDDPEDAKPTQRHFQKNRGVPCLEPFKTLYASFNGNVYPCCFKADSNLPLGNLNNNSGEEIWNSKAWETVKENALKREYPSDICANCLKAQTYPKTHNLPMKLNQYSDWSARNFHRHLNEPLLEQVRALPGNEDIIAGFHSAD
ncbi:MAG: radical SAM/SPASM domain-containing protein [Halioglobus sp.]